MENEIKCPWCGSYAEKRGLNFKIGLDKSYLLCYNKRGRGENFMISHD